MSGESLESGRTPTIDDEDERLYRLGVKRELKREFRNFSAISFAVGVLGYERIYQEYRRQIYVLTTFVGCRIAATISSTFNTPILLGGRAVAVWSWFLGSFGCCAIAASVAGTRVVESDANLS